MDKELTYLQMELNTLENLNMAKETEKELTHSLMEELLKVSGKIINYLQAKRHKHVALKVIAMMVKELTYLQMELNTLENLHMAKKTEKELTHPLMEELPKVSGKIINFLKAPQHKPKSPKKNQPKQRK